MKVLVTGGGGFLGTYLCKKLKESYEVVSFSRNNYQHLVTLGIECIIGDLKNLNDIRNAVKGVSVVFHLAAKHDDWGKKDDYFESNVLGTKNLLKACELEKVEFILFASCQSIFYQAYDQINLSEKLEYPEKFYSFLAESKALAENMIIKKNRKNIKTISLRLAPLWGKEDDKLIPSLIRKSRTGDLRMLENDGALTDFLYIENAVEAFIRAIDTMIDNPSVCGHAYNISDENPFNIWTFLNKILPLYKVDPIEDRISFKYGYFLACIYEKLFKIIGITSPAPKMLRQETVFLSFNHSFSNNAARKKINYEPIYNHDDAFKKTFKKIL